jgi:hypothetical protein
MMVMKSHYFFFSTTSLSLLLFLPLLALENFPVPLFTVVDAFSVQPSREQFLAATTLSATAVAPEDSVFANTAVGGTAPNLKSFLKKPSKVLTVGVEVTPEDDVDKNALSILSMQLRKSKVSSIWTSSTEAVEVFVEEQATARGNFPGPVPVVYDGPDIERAVTAGASAVVVSSTEEWTANSAVENYEVIWKISSIEDAKTVMDLIGDRADDAAFCLDDVDDETSMKRIIESLPKSSLCIATLNPMQPGGLEIQQGKQYSKTYGCASVVIQNACVGDAEDLEYSQFLVHGLTSKASSEFKFSGLTGSTNGHFGGIQANNQVQWRRVQ